MPRSLPDIATICCSILQGGYEAALAACTAARESLPLAETPQCSSAACVRFNEDLSTRAAWYPPSPGATSLAPEAWWGVRGTHSGQGYGRRWWASSGSAEAIGVTEAKAARRGKWAAVRARWLLPHVLSAVLGSPSDACDLSASLGDLASCLGVHSSEDPASLDKDLRLRAQALSQGDKPTGRDLDLLLVGLLYWAARASLGATAETPGRFPSCDVQAGSLAEYVTALSSAMTKALKSDSRAERPITVLPGSVLNLTSVLVCEHLQWATLCLQVINRGGVCRGPHGIMIQRLGRTHGGLP